MVAGNSPACLRLSLPTAAVATIAVSTGRGEWEGGGGGETGGQCFLEQCQVMTIYKKGVGL